LAIILRVVNLDEADMDPTNDSQEGDGTVIIATKHAVALNGCRTAGKA